MRRGVISVILLLFIPEKDNYPPIMTLLGAIRPYHYKEPCTKNEIIIYLFILNGF